MTQETVALYVVPTPLGNLSDLTRRAADVLCAVPWVAAEDTRHSAPLLKHLGSAARLIAAHEHNEQAAADGRQIDQPAAEIPGQEIETA